MSGRLARWLLALVHRPRPAGEATLTIVRHHRVYAAGDRPLYRLGVSAPVFEDQLAMLARAGLAPLTVSEGLARLAEGRGRWVAFSFDDGYADNVQRALPLLVRHGARATFYLTAGLIEERRAPWWDVLAHAIERAGVTHPTARTTGVAVTPGPRRPADRAALLQAGLAQLRVGPERQRAWLDALRRDLGVDAPAPCELASWDELARLSEAGMEIGAHTLTHPFLTTLEYPEQVEEIGGSCALIERRLGTRPTGFAYPAGDHDARSLRACHELGLAHAVTTRRGDVRAADPPHALSRRGLSDGACLGPGGRFSARLALAELDGTFDHLRAAAAGTS